MLSKVTSELALVQHKRNLNENSFIFNEYFLVRKIQVIYLRPWKVQKKILNDIDSSSF